MKLSILTATYNRGKYLNKLYESIVKNLIDELEIEWLIMDDGSNDDTEEIVKQFTSMDKLTVKYFKQENQGKMQAINNLMQYVTGELVMDCDSDDHFVINAFKNIYEKVPNLLNDDSLYGLVFLKDESKNKLSGNFFLKENERTTMFDLYFKQGTLGEKIIVFNTEVRKMFKHELVDGEKFVTEARMYHKMDEQYGIKCYNTVLVEGEYLETGYTHNILDSFKKYPKGYFKYFKEILDKKEKGVKLNKRIYALKHLILFKVLCGYKNVKLENKFNQVLYYFLLLPGIIVTRRKFK